ncbi:MAG TPA: response regulator [Burkholderiales bacterium]
MALDTVSASSAAVMPRVLVAHTNKSMRQLIKLQLVCGGYDVTLAEDAVEAGKQVMQQPPDLIILDVEMPYMDGLEFVSALTSDPGVPLIPVIFLTAREEALERAQRLGATACLTTPLSSEQLLRAVASCVRPASEAGLRAGFRTPRASNAA